MSYPHAATCSPRRPRTACSLYPASQPVPKEGMRPAGGVPRWSPPAGPCACPRRRARQARLDGFRPSPGAALPADGRPGPYALTGASGRGFPRRRRLRGAGPGVLPPLADPVARRRPLRPAPAASDPCHRPAPGRPAAFAGQLGRRRRRLRLYMRTGSRVGMRPYGGATGPRWRRRSSPSAVSGASLSLGPAEPHGFRLRPALRGRHRRGCRSATDAVRRARLPHLLISLVAGALRLFRVRPVPG